MNDDLPVVNVWKYDGSSSQWRLDARIVGYTELSCESAWLTQGTWSVTAPAAAAGVGKVTGSSLVTVDWLGFRWVTGRITNPKTSQADTGSIARTLAGETGLTVFQGINCWPNPTGTLATQPEFGVYNGPAETVVRDLVADHYRNHYGADIVVPASQGRGATVKVKTRMDDLLPHVTKAAQRGGIGVDVGLVDTSGSTAELTLSLYVPEDRSTTAILSHNVGSLRGWEHGETRPTMTKALVGGGGTGATRVWRIVTTPESEAAAARWGGHIEGFVDAADVFDNTELDQRGQEALDQALTDDTFTLEASQAPGMRIWNRARLGDLVSVELASGISTTQPLRGLRLDVTQGSGPKVTPLVGDPDGNDPGRQMARLVRKARRDIRQLQVTRERT